MWSASVAAAASSVASNAEDFNACVAGLKREPAGAVTRVIDAETIGLDDGSEVRLTGTLAPRRPQSSISGAPWAPETAATAALTQLVIGASVEIATAGRTSDRYGRKLAHVFMRRDGVPLWVQGQLLAQGHARAYVLPGSTACIEDMLAIEKGAREAGLGLWANAAYAVRPALRSRQMMGLRSTFQIVEGRVEAIAEVRGAVYLNFGSDWRNDFTAGVVRGRKAAKVANPAFDALALKGKRVRVRGWIERRNGPFIEIVHPGQIEVLDGGGAPLSPAPNTVGSERAPNEKRPALLPGALDL